MVHAKNVEQLVERHMKLWELKRAMAGIGGQPARDFMAHLKEGPWITISRQRGAGATAFAHRLADRLGWQVFDHEIIEILARQTHLSDRLLSSLDEHVVNQVQEVLTNFFLPKVADQHAFLAEMTRVVLGLAHQGKAIIVGRGANFFLNPKFGLRVRTVAPMETRIGAIARADGVSVAEAAKRARAAESEQLRFIRRVFGRDLDDPLGYDLFINMGTLDIRSAVETTCTALNHKVKIPEQEIDRRRASKRGVRTPGDRAAGMGRGSSRPAR